MNIAALVLGIVGLVFSLIPCLGMYAIPVTVLAMILGGLALKQEKKGMAIAGLVCGALGTMMAGYWIYIYFTAKDKLSDAFHEVGAEMKKDMEREKQHQEDLAKERLLHNDKEATPDKDEADKPDKPEKPDPKDDKAPPAPK